MLLRLLLLPLLLLPLLLLPLPLRLLPLPLLLLPLRRRSNSSPAFGQEKASLRAGFFVSGLLLPSSEIAPGEPLILRRNPNPILRASQHCGQCSPCQRWAVVLFREVGRHDMTEIFATYLD